MGLPLVNHSTVTVVLFFTRGVSLRAWDEAGLFAREVALYRRLQAHGIMVVFVTYGDIADLEYEHLLPGISICCNRFKLPEWLYVRLIRWLHRKRLLTADLIKTNQVQGADVALQAALHLRKPLVARCGYLLSDVAAYNHGAGSREAIHSREIEAEVFSAADAVVVTTAAIRNLILHRGDTSAEKITVIPNYVDTTTFYPGVRPLALGEKRLCFIGRLAAEKNIEPLLHAVNGTDVYLDIIGQGPLKASLQNVAFNNPRVTFHGSVPNNLLPQYIRRSTAFILPSLYEGHPKALIEAMACGVPVIGADVPGINNLIKHGQNGLLCNNDVDSIRCAIQTLLADPILQKRLGENARTFVMECFDLEKVVEMELEIYRRLVGHARRHVQSC